jgi:hypothetical protein
VGSHRGFIFIALLIALASIVALGAGAGCQKKAEPTVDPDQQVAELRKGARWDEQPTGVKQEAVAVTQGPTPLVHLFDIGGPIRIIDLTTKSPLVSANVPNRTLVRIDDRNGVTIGKENLLPGPLPAGHTYGIYLDPTTPNIMRQGIGLPADAPR